MGEVSSLLLGCHARELGELPAPGPGAAAALNEVSPSSSFGQLPIRPLLARDRQREGPTPLMRAMTTKLAGGGLVIAMVLSVDLQHLDVGTFMDGCWEVRRAIQWITFHVKHGQGTE